MAKLKTFTVYGRIEVYVGTDVKAESLEAAVRDAKDFSPTDFVTIDGEYIDGKCRVTGVYETGSNV